MVAMTIDEKVEHNVATVFYLCSEKYNQKDISFVKINDHCHYTKNIKVQLI